MSRWLASILPRIALICIVTASIGACVTGERGAHTDPTRAELPPSPSPTTSQAASSALVTTTTSPPTPTLSPSPEPTSLIRPTATLPTPDPTRTAIAAATEAAYPCSPVIGEQVLRGFFDAFNAGDWERVRAHLPDEATPYPNVIVPGADQDLFRGFFLDGVQAGTPEDLIEWLTERHSLHESWFVQDMVIGGNYRNPQWYGLEVANFGIQFVRRADDLSPYTVIGKGLLNCVDGTLLRLYGGFWFAGVSETSGL